MSTAGRRAAVATALLVALAGPALAQTPAAGRYLSELCVALPGQDASCGRADAQIFSSQRVFVRIADIVYQLQLNGEYLEVVLMHGATQIDGFIAPYRWRDGGVLQFDDVDKRMRYVLTLGERR